MILISIILIIIIVYSFAYTVSTHFSPANGFQRWRTDFIKQTWRRGLKTPISTISWHAKHFRIQISARTPIFSPIMWISSGKRTKGYRSCWEDPANCSTWQRTDQDEGGKGSTCMTSSPMWSKISGIQVEIKDGAITKCSVQPSRWSQATGSTWPTWCITFSTSEQIPPPATRHPDTTANLPTDGSHHEDNGIGITKSEQKKIFDKLYRFRQVTYTKWEDLASDWVMSKPIVEEHHGKNNHWERNPQ